MSENSICTLQNSFQICPKENGVKNLDKAKEKEIKLLLKQWGEDNIWLSKKKQDYDNVINIQQTEPINEIDSMFEKCRNAYVGRAEHIYHNIQQQVELKNKIDDALEQLDPIERSIITVRYGKKMKWDYLPAHLPYYMSIRQCHRIHKQCLSKIAEYLGEH